MSNKNNIVRRVLIIASLSVLAIAVMLLPAMTGGLSVTGGAHMGALSLQHGAIGSFFTDLTFFQTNQPIDDCFIHWIILGVTLLYIALFIAAGTKYKRGICLTLWILFALGVAALTFFMECKVCLALMIIALVVLVVTLIVLIVIWRMAKDDDTLHNKGPLITENFENFNLEDARLYVGGREGKRDEFVYIDAGDDGEEYIEDMSDDEYVDRRRREDEVASTQTRVVNNHTTIINEYKTVINKSTREINESNNQEQIEQQKAAQQRTAEQIAAEQKAKEEAEKKVAAERKAREEAEKRAAAERKAREEAEKKAAAERKAREEAEKKAAAEKKVREETEKKAREEKERLDKLKANEERVAREKAARDQKEREAQEAREAKEKARILQEEADEEEKREEERIARAAAEKRAAAKRQTELNAAEAKKAEEERAQKRELDIAAENARIETERAFYATGAAKAPSFRLSREDVLDRMDDMAEDTYDYPIEANTRLRSSEKAPDSLRAGVWTFGVMYESKAGIIKFFGRMDKKYAQKLVADHPTIKASQFSGSEDWYKVIIDSTYYTKREVFAMMDNWYAYVVKRYYSYDAINKKYMTDEKAAALADSTIVAAIMREIVLSDPDLTKAEKELKAAEAAMLAAKSVDLTKKEIADAVTARYGKNVEISRRPNATSTNLPLADTYYTQGISDQGKAKKVCYAYTYQLKDNSVKVIVKLPKVYAEKQALIHTNMCRSKFPAGKSWYVTIIDSSYKSESEVYTLLSRSKSFVESTEARD